MTKNLQGLTHETSATFMQIVEASLRVTQREQLFTWLQSSFQYLFPHEVMFCGIRAPDSEDVHFESYCSSPYDEKNFQAATSPENGVIWRLMHAWQKVRRPLLLGDALELGQYEYYAVPFARGDFNLEKLGLHNIVAHGVIGQNGIVSTFFCFSCAPHQLGDAQAQLIQLLMPYLHAALVRVAGRRSGAQFGKITEREYEVLQWVKIGKTNGEIAQLLNISPNTVKNHVQSILRKLNVQNRSHAVAKATGLTRAQ